MLVLVLVLVPAAGRPVAEPASLGPVWTIVLAAGGGTRFGGRKQFFDLGGEPLVAHPVAAASPASDGIVVVTPAVADVTPAVAEQAAGGAAGRAYHTTWTPPPGVRIVDGGATRAQSVRAGLAGVPLDAGIIVITDAAHPLATAALYRRVVDEVRAGADAAVPGLQLTEVVKQARPVAGPGGAGARLVAGASLAREEHRLVQTPHAFRADLLRAAHARADEAVEDSAMVAAAGGQVVIVPGEPANIHVTTPDELAMARLLLTHVRSGGEHDEFGAGRVHAVR
ncbi:4-diphosphocytidyl-2-methyl-D-erythritol synthase [Frankia canadensis]|uniref:4-diphosphocytidyl-2-methyl-D-erythritol synthase n=1 Tax=Frankia canadensis TaxID=1836972 RepID=A0A2I2L034_9ACTN|nr:4-diphosphocytidyl-2-methyl-D-erythritol synthase [Frankia canadensis]SOU58564.1 4-diphosphocytidyl-2-methyl-D-erythritol synthase [Frankia canadensis]